MKKWILTPALITLAQFSTLAQPVATSANVNPNFTGEFYFAEATNFSPGSAGANQTWNFSNLNLTFAGNDTSVPVSGSPFAALFPTANYCYKFTGFGSDRYYYHNVSSSKYELLSLALTATTGDNYTPDPRTFAVFPYTYNTVYNDTYRTTIETTDTSIVATYDAYGTLILPFGTFNNVIRQKVVKNGQTNYNWFNVSPFYPILQTVLEQNSLGIVKNTTVLGVSENELDALLTICPNPTTGLISITSEQSFDHLLDVELFDMTGRNVWSRKANDIHNLTLDFHEQSDGLFLLKITAANGMSMIRRILKK